MLNVTATTNSNFTAKLSDGNVPAGDKRKVPNAAPLFNITNLFFSTKLAVKHN